MKPDPENKDQLKRVRRFPVVTALAAGKFAVYIGGIAGIYGAIKDLATVPKGNKTFEMDIMNNTLSEFRETLTPKVSRPSDNEPQVKSLAFAEESKAKYAAWIRAYRSFHAEAKDLIGDIAKFKKNHKVSPKLRDWTNVTL